MMDERGMEQDGDNPEIFILPTSSFILENTYPELLGFYRANRGSPSGGTATPNPLDVLRGV
jgi:hypothetical protein